MPSFLRPKIRTEIEFARTKVHLQGEISLCRESIHMPFRIWVSIRMTLEYNTQQANCSSSDISAYFHFFSLFIPYSSHIPILSLLHDTLFVTSPLNLTLSLSLSHVFCHPLSLLILPDATAHPAPHGQSCYLPLLLPLQGSSVDMG